MQEAILAIYTPIYEKRSQYLLADKCYRGLLDDGLQEKRLTNDF